MFARAINAVIRPTCSTLCCCLHFAAALYILLLLFSVRLAYWPSVWERAVHLVYCACILGTFISLYVRFFSFWF